MIPEINYGEWEPDPDVPTRADYFPVGWNTYTDKPSRFMKHDHIIGWRRRRYEVWKENGQTMGRWIWERRTYG